MKFPPDYRLNAYFTHRLQNMLATNQAGYKMAARGAERRVLFFGKRPARNLPPEETSMNWYDNPLAYHNSEPNWIEDAKGNGCLIVDNTMERAEAIVNGAEAFLDAIQPRGQRGYQRAC